MELKLRARLSAYSKAISAYDIPHITSSDVDKLFEGTIEEPTTVTKVEIDNQFPSTDNEVGTVGKDTIDLLFGKKNPVESAPAAHVTKADIDSLFAKK